VEYRNVALIAHVDHGKTTLVDAMLKQSSVFRDNQIVEERVMDSVDLERERGITILAKNTAVEWGDVKINIVDTPGHADFGGEVERALGMVDGVLVLIDAAEGPMPQTRFVLEKALALGLRPIVVVNKVDRTDARPNEVVDLTFDLMIDLDANEEQLDFPILYAVARDGRAWQVEQDPKSDLEDLFQAIVNHIPKAASDMDAPFQMQVANLDYSDYLGRIAIGRILRGQLQKGETVLRIERDGTHTKALITRAYTHLGLQKIETDHIEAGDIVGLAGLEGVQIGDTLTDPAVVEALPVVPVDEPTVSISFSPNTSPLSGTEGNYVTSRHIKDRLNRELLTNIALQVEELTGEQFRVSGRGELHLSILIEQMRREGFEFNVSRPEVIIREVDGVAHEPFEQVVTDVPVEAMGAVIESLSSIQGNLTNLSQDDVRARLEFKVPSRALFGYRTQFLSITRGEGLLSHVFDSYAQVVGKPKARSTGSLVSMQAGKALAYSLFKLQDRGSFFIEPGTDVYVGMIVGTNVRTGDLNVNVCKNKKLTNVRASGRDDNILLEPPHLMTVEDALEYVGEDEFVEITPKNIRLRKAILNPTDREVAAKKVASQ
jgi:GTP-binding protein|tara:strand:- start:14365 stop:16173 length:1809 start_codon:yes stop_codon:yes gene_type:complete